jgi:hypothetical protein
MMNDEPTRNINWHEYSTIPEMSNSHDHEITDQQPPGKSLLERMKNLGLTEMVELLGLEQESK